eukprot:6149897-Prymnesium_polylepis.4
MWLRLALADDFPCGTARKRSDLETLDGGLCKRCVRQRVKWMVQRDPTTTPRLLLAQCTWGTLFCHPCSFISRIAALWADEALNRPTSRLIIAKSARNTEALTFVGLMRACGGKRIFEC